MSKILLQSSLLSSVIAFVFIQKGLLAQQVPLPDRTPRSPVADLTKLKAYSKELAPGQTDWYNVDVGEGDYLEIEVRLRDADVRLSQAGPPELPPRPVEVPRGNAVQTSIYIAPSDGQYTFGISSGATSSSKPYDIRVAALRQASDGDRARLKAGQLTAEAETELKDATLTSLRRALTDFQQAFILWSRLNEAYAVMATLSDMGKTHAALGEYPQAIKYFAEAVEHSQTLNDSPMNADALMDLADSYFNAAEYPKALESYSRAFHLRKQLDDQPGAATSLTKMGATHRELGDSQQALDELVDALAITRGLADKNRQAAALNQLGLLYLSLGETDRAIHCFQDSLPLLRASGYERGEAYALNNLADAYSKLNQNALSGDYLAQSQTKMAAVKDRWGEALVDSNLAELESRLGDLVQAEKHTVSALALRQEVGDLRGQGYVLLNLGDLHARLGDYKQAVEYLSQAAALRESIRDWNGQATALFRVARQEFYHGDLDEARKHMDQVLQLVEQFRLGVVNEALRAAYFASVQEYYEFAANVLMQLDRSDPSKGYAGLAFELSERARARILVEALRSTKIDAPTEADRQLLQEEKEVEAAISAKTQAQTKLSTGRRSGEDAVWGAEIGALIDRYYALQAKIRESSPRFSDIVNPQPLKLAEIQHRVLDNDTTLLEFMLGTEHSYVWCVTGDSIVAAELAPRAEIESAAIDFHDRLSQNRPYEEAANNVARLVLLPIAAHLKNLKAKRLLVISSGVLQYLPFSALPISLTDRPGGRTVPLVQAYEIISAPSASALAAMRETKNPKVNFAKSVAILADPVYERGDIRFRRAKTTSDAGTELQALSRDLQRGLRDSGRSSFARLVFTRAEARAIADSVGPANVKTALDFDASRETAISPELREYQVVHFATHGILDNDHPELSGVVLSLFNERGEPKDGFLRLYEIYALKLPAELVVLSACDTGLGKDVKGEGMISLTRGFMYAGASRVLVTSWAVHDQATAALMNHFYRAMFRDHLGPAAALQSAQRDLSNDKRWRSPYYWAGFMIQGDWL